MIGLSFRLKNTIENFLYKILYGIDFAKYTWKINEDDVLYTEHNKGMHGLFPNDILNGEEFFECISREYYYMFFIDIKAYLVGSNCLEISSYADYMNSDCQMILLCADSTFIDFYCKDIEVLDRVRKNCICNNFEQITVITEDNDVRTRMSIW